MVQELLLTEELEPPWFQSSTPPDSLALAIIIASSDPIKYTRCQWNTSEIKEDKRTALGIYAITSNRIPAPRCGYPGHRCCNCTAD
ncbi:hypothetical protein ACH5RR_006997 [Cinchona calisaya]|uniref:Uncharacterized protein n=1 Tax=Cinchona calisaya TaxID=153742 RepID=A0ABD3AQK0_9GENT